MDQAANKCVQSLLSWVPTTYRGWRGWQAIPQTPPTGERMSRYPTSPVRQPGAPHATTVLIVELLPGTHTYTDIHRDAPPILVVDTGPTELQLSVPGNRVSLDDLHIIDKLMEAAAGYRTALVAHLD
jgi:hypothetical protein